MRVEGEIGGYIVKEKIFENQKSVIYRCAGKHGIGSYIIKILNLEYPSDDEIKEFLYSIDIMKNISIAGIPYVVEVIPVRQTKGIVFIDEGAEAINKAGSNKFTLKEKLEIFLKLVEIIDKVHEAGIVHKDINPSNIIFNRKTGYIGIIDFESATIFSEEKAVFDKNRLVGTLSYIAPEQTGRTSRPIDYRTDYYSIGASFFELFSGKKVFGDVTDAVELIYYHVAKAPPSLADVDVSIPKPVNDIVMKLLAKNSEDRYQSAGGIIHDIKKCLDMLEKTGVISDFEIGANDNAKKLVRSQKLYGREKELDAITGAMNRACMESFEIVMISGKNGSGKSSFAGEIQKQAAKEKCYFSSGKFDKNKMGMPYSAFESFGGFVKYLLSENEEAVNGVKKKILDAIGNNGKVLFDIIPEIKYLIGEQPEVEPLPPIETKNRLIYTFIEFLRVFMHRNTPLTLFLDDCQWANEAFVELLRALTNVTDIRYFMLTIAYDEDEAKANESFMALLEEIKVKSKANVTVIKAENLAEGHISALIDDMTGGKMEGREAFAKNILKITGGQPFLVYEYISALNKNGYLGFDSAEMKWKWNEAGSTEIFYENGKNSLIQERIERLPEIEKNFLKAASIIGETFDLKKVLYLNECDEITLKKTVWHLIEDKLIESEEADFKFIGEKAFTAKFKFANNRVYHAVLGGITEEMKKALHLITGKKMVEELAKSKTNEELFSTVYHLNYGIETEKSKEIREKTAELNYEAGLKARKASAFRAALNYFTISRELKGEQNCPVELLLGLVETTYSCGHYDDMEKYYKEASSKGMDSVTKARFVEISLLSYLARGETKEAVRVSLEVLKELGVTFPKNPGQGDILKALLGLKAKLVGKKIEDFPELPILKDTKLLAVMRVMSSVASSAYLASPELFILMVFKQIEISVKYGNSSQSPFAYCSYGIVLCGILGDIESGYKFGNAAMKLLDKFDSNEYRGRSIVAANLFILHWKNPLSKVEKEFDTAYGIALEAGDTEYAAWALLCRDFHAFFAGKMLRRLKTDMEKTVEKIKSELKMEKQYYSAHSFLTLVDILTAGEAKEYTGSNQELEVRYKEKFEKENDKNGLYYIYFNNMLKNLILGDYKKAYEDSVNAEKYIDSVISTVNYPEYYFYSGIALYLGNEKLTKEMQKSALKKIKNLRKWGNAAPANHLYKYSLLELMNSSHTAGNKEKDGKFDEIIVNALKNGFIQDAALINEIAAVTFKKRNHDSLYKAYIYEAYALYNKWGASAKCSKLMETNPFLAGNNSFTTSVTGSIRHGVDGIFDSTSLIKISQIMSNEVRYERLIEKMVDILMENAGAEKGFFIVKDGDKFFVEASFDINSGEKDKKERGYREYEGAFSKAIVNYVARTGENITLVNASEDSGPFIDEYIQEKRPKSILSMPVVAQNKIVGVLYFENNLVTGAFTRQRIDILKIIASQAAISLENIRMYANLEDKVRERTLELKNANEELEKQKKEAEYAKAVADEATRTKSEFLANMSHEIRTPMNGVIGLTYLLKRTELTERQADFLDKIEDSAKHLLNVINDILDFSKIEAGKLTIDKNDFNLEQILNHVTNVLLKTCEDKNLELIQYTEPGIPVVLRGDSLRIQQVLINLAGNAVKFTQNGEIVIRVELVEKKNKRVMLRFSVKDTGIGLSQEQQSRLFKSFTQADGSITRKYGGTGLGLAISKSFIEMMGGTIGVTSEVGIGSTFYFQIELEIGEETVKAVKKDVFNLAGMKTLIVDDSETSLEILSTYMKSFGCEVECAASGKEALEKIKAAGENAYKLLLIDWKMPELDGISTIEIMKKDSEIPEIPLVIMVSAFNVDEIKSTGEKLNINGYLTKPVQQSSLLDTIVNALGTDMDVISDEAQKEVEAMGILSGRVLLVEDNIVNQIVAKELLETFGLIVDIVPGGLEAIERAEKKEHEVILMDIQMPGIDGYEATKRIQAKGITTPIIAMTAHAMSGDVEKCLAAGMQDYISKPIETYELYKIVKKWLGTSEVKKKKEQSEQRSIINFDGINNQAGLRRMLGNRSTFERVVWAFINEFIDAEDKIKEMVAKADNTALAAYMHAIRGAAGNISAEKLYETATFVEKTAREGGNCAELIPALINETLIVLGNKRYFDEKEKAGNTNNIDIKSIPGIREMLGELREALEMGSFDSEGFYYKIEEKLSGAKVKELELIKQSILMIDYEKAISTLDKLLEIL